MRILLISQFFPPVIGGIELHVSTLAGVLAARGHEVAVATLAPDARSEAGVEVHRVGGLAQRVDALHTTDRRHAPPVPDPGTVSDLRRLIAHFKPDIVHAHNWLGRSFVPLKRASGARYVVTLHDCTRTCAQGRMMFKGTTACAGPRFTRCLACSSSVYGMLKGPLVYAGNESMRSAETSAVDAYIAVSTAVAHANDLYTSGVRFEVIPNFLQADSGPSMDQQDSRLSQLPAEPFILQVGDVVADKGVDVLMEAYRGLHNAPPLVLLGRDESKLGDRAPTGARVLGSVSHGLVTEAWRRCLLGTMPSLCLDASPTVTLEAMAAGKPVVASRLGGLIDQVDDGVTGLLVDAGDPVALGAAIDRLVADALLRERMGLAAQERFRREFTAEVVIDRIEALYESLAATR